MSTYESVANSQAFFCITFNRHTSLDKPTIVVVPTVIVSILIKKNIR